MRILHLVILLAPLIYMVLVAYLPVSTLMLTGMLVMYAGAAVPLLGLPGGTIGIAYWLPLALGLGCCGLLLVAIGGALQEVLRYLAVNRQISAQVSEAAGYLRLLKQRQP